MMLNSLKKKAYVLVGEGKRDTRAQKIFTAIIFILVIANIGMILSRTFTEIPPLLFKVFVFFEIVSVSVFSFEYFVRIWTGDLKYPEMKKWRARLKVASSPLVIIDLLSVIPFYIFIFSGFSPGFVEAFKLMRLFRILKLTRYQTSLSTVGRALNRKKSQLLGSVLIVFITLLSASIIMYYIENPVQPEVFKNGFSGIWWGVITITTVGYGDMYPITPLGKAFGMFIAILGIGLIAVPTGIISSGFMEEITELRKAGESVHYAEVDGPERNESRDCEKAFCPYCGKKI